MSMRGQAGSQHQVGPPPCLPTSGCQRCVGHVGPHNSAGGGLGVGNAVDRVCFVVADQQAAIRQLLNVHRPAFVRVAAAGWRHRPARRARVSRHAAAQKGDVVPDFERVCWVQNNAHHTSPNRVVAIPRSTLWVQVGGEHSGVWAAEVQVRLSRQHDGALLDPFGCSSWAPSRPAWTAADQQPTGPSKAAGTWAMRMLLLKDLGKLAPLNQR